MTVPPQPKPPQPKRREAVPPGTEDPSLLELMRVMDVAREVRKSRKWSEHVRVDQQYRDQLRENLIRTARDAGDSASPREIDAAIDDYLGNHHVYSPPGWSIQLVLAHLWVRRRGLGIALAGILAACAVVWLLSVLFAAIV